MNTDLYLTKEGFEALKKELKELLEVKRPEVALRIKEAREMGDISENAEFDASKQEQSFIEGRITELEEIIKNAKVSDGGDKNTVVVGTKVTVHVDGDDETFHIVGAPEADPMQKKISHESPLGQALLGKKVGDTIQVEVPIGKISYKILSIS